VNGVCPFIDVGPFKAVNGVCPLIIGPLLKLLVVILIRIIGSSD
jgi:hypothetical protein